MAKINIEKLNKLKHKEWIAFIIIISILALLSITNLVLFIIKKSGKTDITSSENNNKSITPNKIVLYVLLAYIGAIFIGTYIYLIIRRSWFNGYLRK